MGKSVMCDNCGKSFYAQRSTARYCSDNCRVSAFRQRTRYSSVSSAILASDIADMIFSMKNRALSGDKLAYDHLITLAESLKDLHYQHELSLPDYDWPEINARRVWARLDPPSQNAVIDFVLRMPGKGSPQGACRLGLIQRGVLAILDGDLFVHPDIVKIVNLFH